MVIYCILQLGPICICWPTTVFLLVNSCFFPCYVNYFSLFYPSLHFTVYPTFSCAMKYWFAADRHGWKNGIAQWKEKKPHFNCCLSAWLCVIICLHNLFVCQSARIYFSAKSYTSLYLMSFSCINVCLRTITRDSAGHEPQLTGEI